MYCRSLTALLLVSTSAFADFSYQQTSRITGGAMAGMMKVAGAFSAKAREPIVSTILVKGDRMAHVHRDKINIIDLSKETFTDIDLQKKTYSVMTFAEMAEAMKRAGEKMRQQQQKEGNDAELSFKASVKETGQTKPVAGLETKEVLVTLTLEGRDTKSGQTGAMDMQMDMWVAPSVAGYDEVQNFYRRMADKLAWSPLSSVAGPFAQQHGKGLAELTREMSKLDGIPVLQITRMGASGSPDPSSSASPAAAPGPTEAERRQAADDARRNTAAEAIGGRLGRLGGGIGGLGGFGRRKKTEEPAAQTQQEAKQQQTAPSAATNGSSAGSGVLMEITTESSNFSSGAVDTAKFEVPAGFKQVEPDMKKLRYPRYALLVSPNAPNPRVG